MKSPLEAANEALNKTPTRWATLKAIAEIPLNLVLALVDIAREWAGGEK